MATRVVQLHLTSFSPRAQTWPMFAILGLAGVIVTFTLTRNMAKSPDF